MSARHSQFRFVLASAISLAAAIGAFAPKVAQADDACTTKKFHYKEVSAACKSGGRKAAKELMKGAVKKAKAAGKDVKCTSCHEDTKDFVLKSNAVDDLKPLL
jgi:hypothetical protein